MSSERANTTVIGGSALGFSVASFVESGPEMVLARSRNTNIEFSNEYWRLRLHTDSPLWLPLVAASAEFYGLKDASEMTGYLIQKKPANAVQWFLGYKKILDRLNQAKIADYPLPISEEFLEVLKRADTPIELLSRDQIERRRQNGGSYIHNGIESAIWQNSGGKIFNGIPILREALEKSLERSQGKVRENTRVVSILNGVPGKLKLIVDTPQRLGKNFELIESTDVIMAAGPWTSDIDLRELKLEIPDGCLSAGTIRPEKVELPPGKTELHSIAMLDFNDQVLDYISDLTAAQLLDTSTSSFRKERLLALGLLDKSIKVDNLNRDQITQNIRENIVKQLLEYGQNGPLIQNTDGAYITREHPTFLTKNAQTGLEWEKYVKDGTWRKIMLGREGDELGDLDHFPPHLPKVVYLATEAKAQEIERVKGDNARRRDAIFQYSYGITPFIDALLYAVDYMGSENRQSDYLNAFDATDKAGVIKQLKDMKVQSGFYHVTCGMKVTQENISSLKPLLSSYHERLNDESRLTQIKNVLRLQKAGINPFQKIDTGYFSRNVEPQPLFMFKNPFAVLMMNKSYKEENNGTFTIADVDLPYMYTLKANGTYLSVISSFRGRGYMAGPGAARLMAEKHRQIKAGNYNPNSKFGRFMENFSNLRMYNPGLMDKLLEDRLVGGSGDI